MYQARTRQILIIVMICQNMAIARIREKRYLHFPPKANLVITMSLLKLIPTETITNTLTELDVAFPLPIHPYGKGTRPRRKKQFERNVIFSKLEEAINHFNFDGKTCLQKFICELNQVIRPSNANQDNLLHDIMDIIFAPNITVAHGCTPLTPEKMCIFL